ncbi:MAG: hypothetical protein HY717_05185 [Planctomycetes bacterium]|nr:hypothetical protein [Planctomycetota bacterium]
MSTVFVAGQGLPPARADEVLERWTFDSEAEGSGWRAGNGIEGLRVAGGQLIGRLTDPDAYLFAPPVRFAMDGLAIRVRWQAPRGGSGQCYFTTDSSPQMGEDKVRSAPVPGGRLAETEFLLDPGGRGAPMLTGFRLDPFNGAADMEFAIDEVAIVRLRGRLEARLAPERSAGKVGESILCKLRVRHLGGARLKGRAAVEVERPVGKRERLPLDLSAEQLEAAFAVKLEKPGVHSVRARLFQEEKCTHELEALVAAGLEERPARLHLETGESALELLPAAEERERYPAARLWAREGGGWKEAGLLLPLGEWVVEEAGMVRQSCHEFRLAERGGEALALEASVTAGGWSSRILFKAEKGARAGEMLAARSLLSGPRGARLLKFAGPALRRRMPGNDPLARHALFGGLEFLEPGWRSSSDRAVGPKFADRWTPHPFKICLPVMAIEAEGVTSALLWNPVEDWAPGRSLPAATFLSPNFLDGQGEHVLQISAPSIPDFVRENESLAWQPYELDEKGVRLTTVLLAACRRPVLETARRWYEHFGIPAAPPAPHDDKATYDLMARCYGQTIYWPEEKGWRHHWFLDKSSHFRPDLAAELLLHSKITGERRWVEATGLDPRRPLLETIGTLWDRAVQGGGGARAAVQAMRVDGTYPYQDTPGVKEATRRHSGGRFDSLGESGSSSLGTCVQALMPLCQHALLTGENQEALEKALAAMRQFRVPRGAQVWEVHQQIPDIRAAALAVEAYRIGYLVTGDPSYLDDAFYWADAGLPFLFSWRTPGAKEPPTVRTSRDRNDASKSRPYPSAELFDDPHRQVNPYGTIPVLGTTFYVISWFGVLVQWCGLEWSWKVLELLEHKDDAILRAAAEGVLRSGLQQTFDRDPWTGLYPDVWNLEGNWAGGALICPHLVVQALRAGGHIPQELRHWSRRAGSGKEALLAHGWGKLLGCEGDSRRLQVRLTFLPGELGEVLIARSPRPRSVAVNGKALPEAPENRQGAGWRHDPEKRLTGIRFAPPQAEVELTVEY